MAGYKPPLSAVLGAAHYGAGIFSAALPSWPADGSPFPMERTA